MENVDACIKEILGKFKSGDCFDSHTVIEELVRNPEYHLAYVRDCPEKAEISNYHGLIAQRIKRFSECVESAGRSQSHDIYGKISECELWRKL